MANEGLYTFVQLYNASGDTLDFEGTPERFPFPKKIGNGDSAWFVHTSDGEDIDVVIYRFNGDQLCWGLMWDNPLDSGQYKEVDTVIRPSSDALRDNWGSIKNNLKNPTNKNESTCSYGGYLAHATIGAGNFPVLQAVLTKVNASN